VSFATDAGSLSTSLTATNNGGVATATLTTSQTATITAAVGAVPPPATGNGTTTPTTQTSGTAKVTVVPATGLVINHPATTPSAGVPATFTFEVTVPTGGNPVRDIRVNWGDGSGTQSLGAVSGRQAATHVYDDPGSYLLTATLIDAAGTTSPVSTTVTVIPIPRPTIVVTPTPQSARVNETINFRIEITAPTGIGIQTTVIDFGDGQSQSLGGATFAVVPHQYLSSSPATKFVVVTVLDTANQVTQGTTSVSISP
jgi:hypothetical protein